MHHIYNTKGIILSSFGVGESNKFFNIFTKELGLIQATAQGVRKVTSKNRYGLQDFSVSNLSLVRGREIWRITNVAPKENLFFLFSKTYKQGLSVDFVVGIFRFLQQLIHGEEKNKELFDLISNFIVFLKKNKLELNDLKNLELITKIRILHNLGYFDDNKFSEFLQSNDFDKDLIKKMSSQQRQAEKEIIEAMEDIHL